MYNYLTVGRTFFIFLGFIIPWTTGESYLELEPPYISPAVPTLEVDPGSDVSLTCNGTAPITWRHDMHEGLDRLSVDVQNSTTQGYVSRLNITNVNFEDLGNYECHYTNPEFDQSVGGAYIYIYVLDRPRPEVVTVEIDTTQAKSVAVGGTLILDCLIDAPKSTLFTVAWLEPQDVVQSHRVTFQIVDMSTQFRRKYRIRLTLVNSTEEDGEYPYICGIRTIRGKTITAEPRRIHIFGPGDRSFQENVAASTESSEENPKENTTSNGSTVQSWLNLSQCYLVILNLVVTQFCLSSKLRYCEY